MNYLKKLEQENAALKTWVADLDLYVNSSKFSENPMVNKNDINLRLQELRTLFFQAGLTLDKTK